MSHICDNFLDNQQTGQIAWQLEIAAYITSVVLCFVHSRLVGGIRSAQTNMDLNHPWHTLYIHSNPLSDPPDRFQEAAKFDNF